MGCALRPGAAPARVGAGGTLRALALATGAGLALLAAGAPAQADLLRDLLGVNPFASGDEQGLREGVYVDDAGEEIHCPRVDVIPGSSYVRRGEGAGLTYQLTIGDVARECMRTQDGRAIVNVGVDVRAVLGPAGRPGRFSSPLTIQLRRGDSVLHRVTRQVSINIPAGQGNAMETFVERGVPLPENTHDLLIEVGYGGTPQKGRRAR